jgi:hypothetical protein
LHTLRAFVAIVVAGCACTAALEAQFELAVFGGVYAPTADFTVPFLSTPFGASTGKHQTALSYGGVARVWFDRRFGVEGSLLFTGSNLAVSPYFATAPDTTLSAHLRMGTVAALIRFPLGDLSNPVWAAVGAAFVSHGGTAYRSLKNTSSLGGSLGVGTRFPLTSRLGIDVGFKGLFYSMALRDTLGTLPSHLQVDLHGWAGLVLRLGHTRGDE